jgi:hypothetical protein
MNHKYITFGIAAIIAVIAVTAVGYAVPQQALAHSGHHNNNGIKVNQDISQVNACTNSSVCVNTADNHADIDR